MNAAARPLGYWDRILLLRQCAIRDIDRSGRNREILRTSALSTQSRPPPRAADPRPLPPPGPAPARTPSPTRSRTTEPILSLPRSRPRQVRTSRNEITNAVIVSYLPSARTVARIPSETIRNRVSAKRDLTTNTADQPHAVTSGSHPAGDAPRPTPALAANPPESAPRECALPTALPRRPRSSP